MVLEESLQRLHVCVGGIKDGCSSATLALLKVAEHDSDGTIQTTFTQHVASLRLSATDALSALSLNCEVQGLLGGGTAKTGGGSGGTKKKKDRRDKSVKK